jgi:hypothetical protein
MNFNRRPNISEGSSFAKIMDNKMAMIQRKLENKTNMLTKLFAKFFE